MLLGPHLLQEERTLPAEALDSVRTALAALDTDDSLELRQVLDGRVETQESPIGLTLDVERSI